MSPEPPTLLERRTHEAEMTRLHALLRRDLDRQKPRRTTWALDVPTIAQWRELRRTKIPVGDGRWI
jgi:hypothetical protein